MENLVNIGSTKKPHGLKGELKVHIEDEYVDDFMEAEVVFIEIKGKQVPFFITEAREGNDMLVKLEDIDTKEAATDLSGRALFLREEDLIPLEEGEERYGDFTQYIGYQLEDTELGKIAEIEDVIEYPQQMLALLTYKDREILIPMHQAFIRSIQHDEKIIVMELPEGLLDL